MDEYIADFLGKKLPKEYKQPVIWMAVLAYIWPLASAWHDLLEAGLEEDTSMMVPPTNVLEIIQRTFCQIGNESEFISQARHSCKVREVRPLHSYMSQSRFYQEKDFGKAPPSLSCPNT